MLKSIYIALLFSLLTLVIFGCSGGNGYPTMPLDIPDNPAMSQDTPDELAPDREPDSQRMLWGFWELSFDPDTMEIAIEPMRNAHPHFNITKMVQPPSCDDCLAIVVNSFDPVTRIVDVDVTLRNKFGIPGRDVRGILFTNEAGHMLMNADEWTHLYDPVGGMDHNPFKAFAKTEPNRVFGGTAEHTENYLVYIPKPPAYASIRYAVDFAICPSGSPLNSGLYRLIYS